jgi:hypothetical protein
MNYGKRTNATMTSGSMTNRTMLRVKTDQEQVREIRVPGPKPAPLDLSELATTLKLNLPQQLLPTLAKQGIHSLENIRMAGGIRHLEGLPVAADDPAVRMLEAHANLSVLSSDAQFNTALIAKGFTSPAAIAATSLKNFVSAVGDQVGDLRAAQAHVKARAQTHFLNNVLTGIRTNAANGYTATNALAARSYDVVQTGCDCKDCESAVSPLAYLYDLLTYARAHLQHLNTGITPQFLTDTFHQPFWDLTVSCSAEEKQVRQVRICIEVLRSYLNSHVPDPDQQAALNAAVSAYLFAAYSALLIRIGTSYDEIRLARSDKPPKRQALAERLGINLGSSQHDHLDALFLDPKTITEESLEELFGLADTTRDPLSDGAKRGDSTNIITRWNLDGVKWGSNTDQDGVIYVSVNVPIQAQGGGGGGTSLQVSLFRDAQQQQLVAYGELATGTSAGTVTVLEENNSGLSGRIVSGGIASAIVLTGIELQAVPRFLSWRLQYLRMLWEEQDRPSDAYSEGTPSSGTDGRLSLLKVKAPLPS